MKLTNPSKYILLTAGVLISHLTLAAPLIVDYKGSKVIYDGQTSVTKAELINQATLIDQADRRFEAKWQQVVAEKVSEDPFFNKVWTDLSTFRKGYDLWEANAFLPRAVR